MLPYEYCPLGSPSLLNGDFYENVARLKDFSWSGFLSSIPINITTPTGIETIDFSLGKWMTYDFKNNPKMFILSLLIPFSCIFIVCFIAHLLVSRIKTTGNSGIKLYCFSTVCLVFALMATTICRSFPEFILFPAFIVFSLLYFPSAVILFKCTKEVVASRKDRLEYENGALKIFFIISGVLVFFFSPVYRPDECPLPKYRMNSETLFGMSFPVLAMLYMVVDNGRRIASAETIFLYKKGKQVGRYVKKEGLGWVKQVDESRKPIIQQFV